MVREVRTVVTSWKRVRRLINLQEKEKNKLSEMMDMSCILFWVVVTHEYIYKNPSGCILKIVYFKGK